MYETLGGMWREVYDSTLRTRGLKLRDGITLAQLETMLTAAAEGLGLRIIAGQEDQVLNPETRTSLLGTIVMALVMALVDAPSGSPTSGMTVKELFQATLDGQGAAG